MDSLVRKIATDLSLNPIQVQKTIELLVDEQCTIPFVARYRKEMTGSLDEVVLRDIRDRFSYGKELEALRSRYLKVVAEHCKSKPELAGEFEKLKAKFENCQTKQELEDLYLPFKPKRRTRAMIAREKGLEALLEKILAERATIHDLLAIAAEFVTKEGADVAKDLVVANAQEALAGAGDILAEQLSENPEFRGLVRMRSFEDGYLVATKASEDGLPTEPLEKKNGKRVEESKYENYFDYKEKVNTALSHRVMAVRRGEAEKVLRVHIEVDVDSILGELRGKVIGKQAVSDEVKAWLTKVVEDAYKRLMAPSIETEIRLHLKNTAEAEAIKVFSQNLQNLLLLPPIPHQTVMGIDPGIRTGSKIAVVSQTGKLLDHYTIYPDLNKPNDQRSVEARKVIAQLVEKHRVGFISIGNGTASREVDHLVIQAIKEFNLRVKRVVVNEAGASVYSTEAIAREEFPDLDPTIRSAVSIARRLQDPLAELVKIEPRSIGVGQYQHDCNLTKLNDTLKETVESCVNSVGVNINTASYKLLSYVSGIGPTLAKSIVNYRDEKGPFESRSALMEITGFGPKAFQQAAGFLRIPSATNPLDNSSVHPERYSLVEKIATDLSLPLADLVGKKEIVETLKLEKYVDEKVGMPTLLDIASELIKPGRDPRRDGSRLTFSDDIASIEDLKIGMKIKGTVSNVTNFGAFVDIGVHQDGLVHISELSDTFVKDPTTVVHVGKVLDVYVLDVDVQRKRISLSCRGPREKSEMTAQAEPGNRHEQRPAQREGGARTNGGSYDRGGQRAPNGQGGNRRPDYQRGPRDDRAAARGPSGHGRDNRDQRAPQDRPKHPPRKPVQEPQFSMGDLLAKFNNRS